MSEFLCWQLFGAIYSQGKLMIWHQITSFYFSEYDACLSKIKLFLTERDKFFYRLICEMDLCVNSKKTAVNIWQKIRRNIQFGFSRFRHFIFWFKMGTSVCGYTSQN